MVEEVSQIAVLRVVSNFKFKLGTSDLQVLIKIVGRFLQLTTVPNTQPRQSKTLLAVLVLVLLLNFASMASIVFMFCAVLLGTCWFCLYSAGGELAAEATGGLPG